MQKTRFLFFGLSLLFAMLAAYAAVSTVNAFVSKVPVVVAKGDISAFTPLLGQVEIVELPPAAIMSGEYFASLDGLEGAFAQMDIVAGTVIRPGHVYARPGGSAGLPLELTGLKQPDYRAFAIPFENTRAVGGRLQKGDRVDVIAAVVIGQRQDEVAAARVVAQGVLVMDVVHLEGDAEPVSIVLALPLTEIEEVALLLETGAVYLALNPYDRVDVATQGITGPGYLEKHFGGVAGGAQGLLD